MIRKDFFLTNNQFRFLRKLEGNVSEHIRRAIDKYIEKMKGLKVSSSLSKPYGRAKSTGEKTG